MVCKDYIRGGYNWTHLASGFHAGSTIVNTCRIFGLLNRLKPFVIPIQHTNSTEHVTIFFMMYMKKMIMKIETDDDVHITRVSIKNIRLSADAF